MLSTTLISTFPIWQYLSQPIGECDRKLIVSPVKFWHMQKVQYIERCWVMSYESEKRMP